MSERCSPMIRQRILHLRYGDGYTQAEVARMLGIHRSLVEKVAPGRVGKVSNDRLRDAFLESGVSAAEVARRIGWLYMRTSRPSPRADGSRVRRTLGLYPDQSGKGYQTVRSLIDYEVACNIAEAIGVSPWAVIEEDAA